jgi:hypothetical protein
MNPFSAAKQTRRREPAVLPLLLIISQKSATIGFMRKGPVISYGCARRSHRQATRHMEPAFRHHVSCCEQATYMSRGRRGQGKPAPKVPAAVDFSPVIVV